MIANLTPKPKIIVRFMIANLTPKPKIVRFMIAQQEIQGHECVDVW